MVTQKLSISKTAIARRIKNLPTMATDAIEGCAKGYCRSVRVLFREGVKENDLGLLPLKEATMDRKEAMGFDLPESPLYGLGEAYENTYVNLFEIVKDEGRKKFILSPKDAYHKVQDKNGAIVDSKFKLKDLFMVHEYGCTIANGFGKGILIRIPPRPALRYAYTKFMAMLKKRDPAREVRQAIIRYVKENDSRAMDLIAERDWATEIVGNVGKAEKKEWEREA